MASILKVDTITGVATAGSIAITGEGNSTTTNLQQGLAKAFCNFNGASAVNNDSFNISGITDNGTGDFTITFTNNFNVASGMCGPALAGRNSGVADDVYATAYDLNTTDIRYNILHDGGSLDDCGTVGATVHGDLA